MQRHEGVVGGRVLYDNQWLAKGGGGLFLGLAEKRMEKEGEKEGFGQRLLVPRGVLCRRWLVVAGVRVGNDSGMEVNRGLGEERRKKKREKREKRTWVCLHFE